MHLLTNNCASTPLYHILKISTQYYKNYITLYIELIHINAKIISINLTLLTFNRTDHIRLSS